MVAKKGAKDLRDFNRIEGNGTIGDRKESIAIGTRE